MKSLFPGRNDPNWNDWVGGAYGRRLDDDWPEGVLAFLEVEHEATPERVERARLLFKEARLADFSPLGSKGGGSGIAKRVRSSSSTSRRCSWRPTLRPPA